MSVFTHFGRLVVLIAAVLCVTVWAAKAHDWYPWECCSAVDCAVLDPANVRVGARGYAVVIPPGSHPQWKADRPNALLLTVPYKDTKPSPDGKFHICLNPAGALLCFFHTPGGV